MSRRKRQPRPPRKQTATSVVRTHLAVVAGIANHGTDINVHHEAELVKASVLYADSIELLSLGNQMIRELGQFTNSDPSNIWTLLASLDDKTLRQMNPSLDPDKLRQGVALLNTLPPEALRTMAELDPQMAELSEFADVLDESHEHATSGMAELRAIADQMRAESGAAELELALDHKLVRFNENVMIGGDSDTVVRGFTDEIRRYLQDPTKFVLLDSTIADLVTSMIKEGLIRPPERSFSNASEAVLGTGFLARLPAFTDAPMDEVLDLRQDLDEPLGRYRRKVSQLRSELRTGPFDQHIQAEVDAVWRAEIAPAIGEVRQAMADHGLVRETVRALGANLSDFSIGTWLPAGLAILSANVFDLGAAVSTTLTAGTALAPTVAKGLMNRSQGRAAARSHDLYYLYEVDRRLGS